MTFENKGRLLTDDEKELVKVLESFHTRIEELTQIVIGIRHDVDELYNTKKDK